MTLHREFWQLPGPGGFVRDVIERSASRHVVAILPKRMSEDPSYSDSLGSALVLGHAEATRLSPWSSDGSLVPALGAQIERNTDNDLPVTVHGLLTHEDAVGRTFVIVANDLDPEHRAELPDVIRRLGAESRALPAPDRATFAIVGSRAELGEPDPGGRVDIALADLWFWDRIGRWDVAALVASAEAGGSWDVLKELRIETIVEAARWDVGLALRLSGEWSGDVSELREFLEADDRCAAGTASTQPVTIRNRPPSALLESWDERLVDMWCGYPSAGGVLGAEGGRELDAVLWSAQARILLPWLEVRRGRLERVVRGKLGSASMDAAIAQFSMAYDEPRADAVVEFSTLFRIVSARLGSSEPRLRNTARLLRDARNKLAHIVPLPVARIEELVADTRWLPS